VAVGVPGRPKVRRRVRRTSENTVGEISKASPRRRENGEDIGHATVDLADKGGKGLEDARTMRA